MSYRIFAAIAAAPLLFATIGVAPAHAEKNIGHHSQAEIRTACNAVGGDLLGVSDLGSYGCENPKTGGMILCNKKQECTAYSAVKTKSGLDRFRKDLGIGKVAARQ